MAQSRSKIFGLILGLVIIFFQIQAALPTNEGQQNGSQLSKPNHGEIIHLSAKSKVLSRQKRQLNSLCPARPASSSGRGNPRIMFYSPSERKDIKYRYGGKDWSGKQIKSLMDHGFNISQPTLIYLHAYTQSATSFWLSDMRKMYDKMFPANDVEKATRFNLLFFDWSDFSRLPYTVAASWVPHLGKVLSQFLKKLVQRDSYDMNQVHLVSYSLSTHIAGNAGRQMPFQNRIGKITALDPTGVCFHEDVPYAKEYALRPTDANFVVARHYDVGGLGSRRLIGGLDVFVNGGNNQPNRFKREIEMEDEIDGDDDGVLVRGREGGGGGNFFGSHTRAAFHEAQLRNEDCQEVAYSCRSYSGFLKGECGSCGKDGSKCYFINTFEETRMKEEDGVQVQSGSNYKPRTKMYIKTGGKTYCLHHYQLLVRMKPSVSSSNKKLLKSGFVTFDFGYDVKVTPRHQLKRNREKFTTLLTQNKRIEPPDQITVKTESQSDLQDFINGVESVELNYMSRALEAEREQGSAKYCPSGTDLNKLVKC